MAENTNTKHYMKMALAVHLLQLAEIDGKFDEKEKKFWYGKIREFGLSIGEQTRCLELKNKAFDPKPLTSEEKKLWREILEGMMNADENVAKEEQTYIEQLLGEKNEL